MSGRKCKTGQGFIPGIPVCLECGDDCQCYGCRTADERNASH